MHELDTETLGLVPESDTPACRPNETDTSQVEDKQERPQGAQGNCAGRDRESTLHGSCTVTGRSQDVPDAAQPRRSSRSR